MIDLNVKKVLRERCISLAKWHAFHKENIEDRMTELPNDEYAPKYAVGDSFIYLYNDLGKMVLLAKIVQIEAFEQSFSLYIFSVHNGRNSYFRETMTEEEITNKIGKELFTDAVSAIKELDNEIQDRTKILCSRFIPTNKRSGDN